MGVASAACADVCAQPTRPTTQLSAVAATTTTTTTTTAAAAALSPAWLPTVEEAVGMATHPFWAEILPTLGVVWLLIQIGFFLRDRINRTEDPKE